MAKRLTKAQKEEQAKQASSWRNTLTNNRVVNALRENSRVATDIAVGATIAGASVYAAPQNAVLNLNNVMQPVIRAAAAVAVAETVRAAPAIKDAAVRGTIYTKDAVVNGTIYTKDAIVSGASSAWAYVPSFRKAAEQKPAEQKQEEKQAEKKQAAAKKKAPAKKPSLKVKPVETKRTLRKRG